MITYAPIPTRAPKETVHEFAEKVAAKLRFDVGDAIEPVVAKLGGRISYRSSVDEEDGLPDSIIVRSKTSFTIFLSTMTSYERDRFTIAHELGHLFLHYPLVSKGKGDVLMKATRWVNEEDKTQQRAEWEANWFAAGFLMPADLFRNAYSKLNADIASLATLFAVSKMAAETRIRTLRLDE